MEIFIFWLIGWVILSLGNYLYNITDKTISKKLHAWHAFWYGIFSWIGIGFWVAIFIVYLICEINDWIENKLS